MSKNHKCNVLQEIVFFFDNLSFQAYNQMMMMEEEDEDDEVK